jgi:hypothetical protein
VVNYTDSTIKSAHAHGYKDIAKFVASRERYRVNNKKKLNLKSRNWQAKWRAANPNASRTRRRLGNMQLKVRVLMFHGGKCNWRGCDINNMQVLELDHVAGNGHLERKVLSYDRMLKRSLRHPVEYQVLCGNHNNWKRFLNGENRPRKVE